MAERAPSGKLDWVVEPFRKDHERAAFASGQSSLDDFLRAHVSQYEKRRLGKTYVAVLRGQKRVLGYYTLAAGSVAFEHLPPASAKKLPKHPVPVVLLARLAVDRSVQGQGLGEGLLVDALNRSLGLAANLGIHAIEVHAIDDGAAAFYRTYGFVPLVDRPRHLFFPMSLVGDLLG